MGNAAKNDKKLYIPKWMYIFLIIVICIFINFYLNYAEENERYNKAIDLSNQGKWNECVNTLINSIPKDVCEKVQLNKSEILYIYANANSCIEEHNYEMALYYLNRIDPSKVQHQFSNEVTELKYKLNSLMKEQEEIYSSICPKGGLGDTLEIAQKKLGGEISNGMLMRGVNHALASANSNKIIFNINMSFGNKYKVISWEMMDRYIPSDKVFVDKGYDRATELYYCRYTSQSLAEKIPESEGKFILLQMAYGGDITAATGHEID